jgi:hypothetical protein
LVALFVVGFSSISASVNVLINSSFQDSYDSEPRFSDGLLRQRLTDKRSILVEEQSQNPARSRYALEVDQGLTTSLTDTGSFLLAPDK